MEFSDFCALVNAKLNRICGVKWEDFLETDKTLEWAFYGEESSDDFIENLIREHKIPRLSGIDKIKWP